MAQTKTERTDNLLLVGMLDSPFVRRTAISLECLRVPFAHEAVSVFSTFEKFRAINPVVKVRQRATAFASGHAQACITAAVAWQFMQSMPSTVVPAAEHPHLAALSARMEQRPEFLKYPPDGPGVQAPATA